MTAHRLVLLRHAKSDWPPGVADLERPLAERGRRDAPVAGAWIAEHVGGVGLALVSPAMRTRQTWDLAAGAWSPVPPMRIEPRLYDAGSGDMLEVARGCDESVGTLVLVAHNPGTEDLAFALSGDADPAAAAAMAVKYPTSGIAVLEVSGGWADLGPAACRLAAFTVPRG